MRWVIALALLLAAARPAAAKPKIPKVLEDVELREDGAPDPNSGRTWEEYELRSLKVISKVKKLGGRAVIAFRHEYSVGVRVAGALESEAQVELAIVDAKTKSYVFREWIVADGHTYDVSWPDLDKDGEPELKTELRTGAPDRRWSAGRVLQVRYGAFVDVGEEGAKCGRARDDTIELGGTVDDTLRDAAFDRLRKDIDYGTTTGTLHCDLVDAVALSPEATKRHRVPAWPEVGAPIAFSPVAVDCPALSWAERHGVELEPRRAGAFVTTDRLLGIVYMNENGVVTSAVDTWGPIVWSQTWVLDDHLFLFAEALQDKTRRALVWDVVAGTLDFYERLWSTEVPVVEISSADPKVVVFVASDGAEKRTLWSRTVRTWMP